MPLATALLTGLAVAVAVAPARSGSRLAEVLRPPKGAHPRPGGPGPPPGGVTGPPGPGPSASPRRRVGPVLSCVLAAAALVLVLGRVGAVAGLGVLLLGPGLLRRLEPRSVRRERERFDGDLPLALELLGACLAGGAGLLPAVRAVAAATPGPCGDRLGRVAAALEVGLAPADAWARLAEPAGAPPSVSARPGGGAPGLAGSAVRALARAGEAGTPVAVAVTRLAAQARADRAARGQAAAERAGVLAVGPLGLCFLPAFVLLGVVPVVAGLVGPLLAGF